MTKEERVFIEAKDLLEIEFVCGNKDCSTHARVACSLRTDGFQIPKYCPCCNHEWFSAGSGDPRKDSLLELVQALRKLREGGNPRFDVRFRVHIENVP